MAAAGHWLEGWREKRQLQHENLHYFDAEAPLDPQMKIRVDGQSWQL